MDKKLIKLMKYYFISYRWKNEKEGFLDWNYSNCVSDIHPVLWLKETIINKKKYNDTYQIEFYQEISKEAYDEVNGWID